MSESDVCMVYDENGNAFDAFPYEPDELERRADRLRGWVTITDPPEFVLATSAEVVAADEEGAGAA